MAIDRWYTASGRGLSKPALRGKICAGMIGLLTAVSLQLGCNSSPSAPPVQQAQDVRMAFPNGGEIFKVDSTITITAFTDSTKALSLQLWLSVDGGKKWTDPFGMAFTPRHGRIDVPYTIPDTLDFEGVLTSARSATCLVKAQNYEPKTIFDISDGYFTIQ